jgi:hypothetical protein
MFYITKFLGVDVFEKKVLFKILIILPHFEHYGWSLNPARKIRVLSLVKYAGN